MGLTMGQRKALTREMAARYRGASRPQKKAMLDEFVCRVVPHLIENLLLEMPSTEPNAGNRVRSAFIRSLRCLKLPTPAAAGWHGRNADASVLRTVVFDGTRSRQALHGVAHGTRFEGWSVGPESPGVVFSRISARRCQCVDPPDKEFSMLSRQCLDRRIVDIDPLRTEGFAAMCAATGRHFHLRRGWTDISRRLRYSTFSRKTRSFLLHVGLPLPNPWTVHRCRTYTRLASGAPLAPQLLS